jgi:3-hydroxyacyl-CoA dehydrogenase/enoyl-CoA hydratase/3-hydroxybutyryl-CoA epimerase
MAYFQTDNLWVNRLADGVADLILDVSGGKVNALSRSATDDLDEALDRVAEDAGFRLLILRTAKAGSFCAGFPAGILADLTPADFGEIASLGQRLCQKLAQLRLPTVAVVAGGCLGSGLELALACDYRVAVNKPSTIFGFPDLELGLIPFWGGTQRLPKLVGLERSLQMLLGGRRLVPGEARSWGLIDEITEEEKSAPAAFLKDLKKKSPKRLPLRTLRQKLTESTRLGRWLVFRGAERLLRNRLPEDMPAPWHALDAVRTGLRAGLEAGLERERTAVQELARSEACRNLLHLHLERHKLRVSRAGEPRRAGGRVEGSRRPRNIGIIGSGNRGPALIHMAVSRGCRVVVRETSEAALGFTLFHVLSLFQQEASRGAAGSRKLAAADLKKKLANIHGTTAWKGFDDVDLVLDAGEGDAEQKKSRFQELERHTSTKTLLVTTGSTVTVADAQEGMVHPERVGGMHFLAPVGRSLLVEVAVSNTTDADVLRRLMEFSAALGRAPQPVKDAPGFLVERLLFPYLSEAVLLVKEGFNPLHVDEAMTRFGMNQGPLEHLDLMGLDGAAELARALRPTLEPRLAPAETFDLMVEHNWLGRQAGLGFYQYRGKKPKANQALVAHLRAQAHATAPHTMDAVSRADQRKRVRRRLVWLMINEAAWCMEESRTETPAALDLALTLAGWAPHRGGPLHYARHVGLDIVNQELEQLAAEHGPRYRPCPALQVYVG